MDPRLRTAARNRASGALSRPLRSVAVTTIAVLSCILVANVPVPTRAQMMQH